MAVIDAALPACITSPSHGAEFEGKAMLELKIGATDDGMDVLTFVSSVVGSIAWPVAAFAIAVLFRSQIRSLMDRIKRLSMGENSVDFGQKLDEAEAEVEADTAISAAEPQVGGVSVPDDRTAQLISLSPSAAVLDGWKLVERKALELAQPLLLAATERSRLNSFRVAVKALFDAGRISRATYSMLMDLQALRNAAVHTDDVSALDAIRFANLAKNAMFMLDGPDVRPDSPKD